MSDGSPKVPAQASPLTSGAGSATASATASYARIYEEQQPRLVAYARSLTRNNSWAAEDVVAEAHFRVWRRLSQGHEIENVPAYLMTTVRHLAATAVGDARETPHDPRTAERTEIAVHATEDTADPAEQISSVDLLVRVLGQLPERWVQALWLAEAEGQPLETVGERIGAKQGATAVLLHRAREGMRQAFLRNQTGAPDDPACEVHWVRMPAYVRGNATPRQSERLLAHVDACDDCRGRLAVLMRANDRLPALVGPALLVFAVGGAGKFLLPFIAGSTGAATTVGGALHTARQAVTGGGGAKGPTIAAGATVAGAALAMMIALGVNDPSPAHLSPRTPLAETPVAAGPSEGPAVARKAPEKPDGQRWADGGGGRDVTAVGVVGSASGADSGSGTAVRGPVVAAEPVGEVPGEEGPGEEGPGAEGPAAPDAEGPAVPGVDPEPEPPAAEPPYQEGPEPRPAPGGDGPSGPVPAPAPAPEKPAPENPGPENPGPEDPGHEDPYPTDPGAEGPSTPVQPEPVEEPPQVPVTPVEPVEPEEPEAPEVPDTPQPSEPPAAPEPPVTPEIPEPPVTPDAPDNPTPPETTAPDPAPVPQPTPGNPGGGCGN